MDESFVPGPWFVADKDNRETTGIPVWAKNPSGSFFRIATVSYMGTAPSMGPEQTAQLIAAAPLLVQALSELLEACPVAYDYHGNPMDPELGAALNKAEAALKAAGV
jgi:hypothetical protein